MSLRRINLQDWNSLGKEAQEELTSALKKAGVMKEEDVFFPTEDAISQERALAA